MPTYGYRCTACGHTFERFQKITDPAVTQCESCDSPVKKILYPVGIQFKGEGFYINDYARKGTEGGTKSGAPSVSSESGASSESSAPSSDSKPAAESAPAAPSPAPAASKPTTPAK